LVVLALVACGSDDVLVSPGGDGGGRSTASTGASSSQTGSGGSGGEASNLGAYPVPDWSVGDPEEHGIDAGVFAAAAAAAEENGSYCLLVVRHGVIVAEHYWQGRDQGSRDKSFSMAKSYTSALVGIALGRGDLADLDQDVADLIPEWQDGSHAGLTLRHLVSMQSGLEWSLVSDYVEMATLSSNHTDYALGLEQDAAPGSSWVYHNGAVQVIEPLFRAATGMAIESYAEQELWSRLGMSAEWNHDPAGNPTTYAHVLSSCRDHARFGYLYLRGGEWADGQVVPADYLSASLSPSQDHNKGYGFLWWLNGQTPTLDAFGNEEEGILAPFAPPDMVAARGFGDQFIDVIPSLDMVIVRIGPDPTTAEGFDLGDLIGLEDTGTHEAIVGPIVAGTEP
jgi:CubicO group peptidase (beta-lactamase class C family)